MEDMSAERSFLRRSTPNAARSTPSRVNGFCAGGCQGHGFASGSLVLRRTSVGRHPSLGAFPRHADASCCRDGGDAHVLEAAQHFAGTIGSPFTVRGHGQRYVVPSSNNEYVIDVPGEECRFLEALGFEVAAAEWIEALFK